MKLRDLVGLLRGLAPAWGPFQKLTAAQLRKQLTDAGVRTINASNTHWLDPADLRRAIAGRAAAGLDEEG